ncbi:Non-specific serine/threonine protein kinase protein [Dioscorea alata]|uniref:Non-specific serine/threonine protein kinase protein n=1 Tax=Dioscorea alata TaxID=55571 RepID=A0ACB7TS53_DIOAL|nr:Non-specific serine/threonine protein kinase protein [Dioscorea alata]
MARHGVVPLFLFLCYLIWSPHCQAQTLAQNEVDALKKIGAKLGKQWDFTVDPCSGTSGWVDSTSTKDVAVNVTCGPCNATSSCHVISVILKSQNLTGTLPGEFANLTSLQIIDLSRNYLNGTIPSSWSSLPLTNLTLLGNRITGTIPAEFGKLLTLQAISLEDNLIEGPLPESLGNLINLSTLHLSANNISGKLPASLGHLKNLTEFRIDGNPITGKIPSFMSNWTKISRIDMQGTSMELPFPASFSELVTLRELRVTDIQGGDGKFPALNSMTNLIRLVLRNLSISDELPDFIGHFGSLKTLDLSFNNLTGQIPDNYVNLGNSINYMYLTSNNLFGAIPSWILTSTKQQRFDLSYNSFNVSNGLTSCPTGAVNLVSSYSSTDSNSIPSCMRKNYPCSGKAKNYKLFINCGGGEVTIGDEVYQSDNDPQGPSTYKAFDDQWAYSSTGDFLGNSSMPYLATNVTALTMPNPDLYMTARLSPISLRYYGLCLQNGNYTVNLHFAEIMFTDDKTFFSVGRRLFDVYIQGNNVLRDFNIAKEANGTGREKIKSFTANVTDHTLEIHFQWVGKGTNAIPQRGVYGPLISAISVTPNFEPDLGESKLSTGAIVGIVIAGCAVIALISICIWLYLRRKNAKNRELIRSLELQTGYFTLRQIKNATRNFDAANKIGEGGFGPVYKGVLPDGSTIAVKQLSSKSRQGNREFVTEIGMISALQHPNLVKLFGCCIEGNQLLLIYEYMENNSLASALFGDRHHLNLDWQTRHKICLGIARGLAYLHEESRLKIVHRDIKATNVLLDKDLNAKISDFGLARLSNDDETHISTRIAGTIGYMAPEYAMRGYLTDKADVYSFGVVVLETVSGVSNTNYKPKEECVYLLDWAYVLQERGNLLELVDKSLGANFSEKEAQQMLNLALACTNPSPSLRPTMSAVVSILDGKHTMPMSFVKPVVSSSDDARLKALEKLPHDRQPTNISMDGPWIDSSVSLQSSYEENTSTRNFSSSQLLPDHTD